MQVQSNQDVIDRFLFDNQNKLSELTVKAYKTMFNQFFSFISKRFDEVKPNDIRAWLSHLDSLERGTSTKRNKLSYLKNFYNYCYEEGLIERDPAKNILKPKKKPPLPQYLKIDQLEKLRQAPKNKFQKAMIETFYDTGVRASEFLNIKLLDINWANREILITNGKGKRQRVVLFTEYCKELLKDYLNDREDHSPYLFINTLGEPLGYHILTYNFLEFTEFCSFKVTPLILRHTFASHLLLKGMPIRAIQSLLGHEKIENTEVYTRLL
ncbi:tyrosine-type recombinase/integrase [Natranaerobius trueperi]|uniref:Integrase n=1 Tax=Natranaerobius trueperi TaxID=759412 RepID=A0A226BYV3_9FIRM|nr:tyrosine-type recombinase/integrase [Natranaerobius trueperi]OWZ83379.1 integrase [Natranaerobius trueperi]